MLVSILILVLAVLIVAGSYTTGQDKVKAPIEPLYGTWVNPDYNTEDINAKLIIKPDGTSTECSHTDIEMPDSTGTYTIIDSWIDSDGKKYYKVDAGTVFFKYRLYRLDETDSVLEWVWSNSEIPSEIDPNHYNYRILYRQ
jgi:hypothetical protein